MSRFHIGDKVEFESAPWQFAPRWTIEGKDLGSSGFYTAGVITEITDEIITVEYLGTGLSVKSIAYWPNYNHARYTDWQWSRKGYLTKIKKITNCECGAAATYGVSTNLHSHWCFSYKKEKK